MFETIERIFFASISAILLAGVALMVFYEPPLTAALEVCGDTPKPVDWRDATPGSRFPTLVPHPPEVETYLAQVKSVDDCRKAVLDHFNQRKD